jgi:hypothetical protein
LSQVRARSAHLVAGAVPCGFLRETNGEASCSGPAAFGAKLRALWELKATAQAPISPGGIPPPPRALEADCGLEGPATFGAKRCVLRKLRTAAIQASFGPCSRLVRWLACSLRRTTTRQISFGHDSSPPLRGHPRRRHREAADRLSLPVEEQQVERPPNSTSRYSYQTGSAHCEKSQKHIPFRSETLYTGLFTGPSPFT